MNLPIIASGGLRNGLEIAKCISLGANACGMASPMLKHAAQGKAVLTNFAKKVLDELRTTMFITGSKNLEALRSVRKVVTPPLTYWQST